MAQIGGGKAVYWLGVAKSTGQCLDQQRHSGEALLTVDHQQRGLMRDLRQALLNIDDRADEVDRDGIACPRSHDIVP